MSAEPTRPTRPLVNITPGGREALKIYAQEIATYRRELPRLLQEGEAGRYALIKGDEVLSVWDTQRDVLQAGRERFGLAPIFVQEINPRDIERFALLVAQLEAECQSSKGP